ncbi:hypothetical protein BKA70DRAFT_1480019 [Coprinopsis sp. MPI-PUGE-AT-0042]|nr:hypothetical protein BKA70DRAFT_1480019 [Coprinopsis sp. MPI-PUGE-AT-0042]
MADDPEDLIQFGRYTSTSSLDVFSGAFFERLAIRDAASLNLPQTLPPGSTTVLQLSTETPTSDVACAIAPGEIVACFEDLRSICTIEHYRKGVCSVVVELSTGSGRVIQTYHLRKIRLLQSLANYTERLEWCMELNREVPRLLREEQDQQHPQLKHAVDHFLSSSIGEQLRGFLSAKSQVLYAATLLRENWVDEEIFNALAEIAYLRQFIPSSSLKPRRRLLFLPTYFLSHIEQAFSGVPHLSTSNITNLRQRISGKSAGSSPVDGAVIFKLDGRHYTTYIYPFSSATLIHADSLHHLPAQGVRSLVNHFIRLCFHEQVSGFTTGEIARQGQAGGEGSCGITALNFAQVWGNSDTPVWVPSHSRNFRMSALRDLILYHYLASNVPGAPEQCLDLCVGVAGEDRGSDFAFGYSDFNLFQPQPIHPIFQLGWLPLFKPQASDPRNEHPRPFQSNLMSLLNPSQSSSLSSLSRRPASPPLHLLPGPTLLPAAPISGIKRKASKQPAPSGSPRHVHSSPIYVGSDSDDSEVEEVPTAAKRRAVQVVVKVDPEIEELSPTIAKELFVDNPRTPEKKHSLLPDFQHLSISPRKPDRSSIIDLTLSPSPVLKIKRERQNRPVKLERNMQQSSGCLRSVSISLPGGIAQGDMFSSFDEAREAVYASELRLGHNWTVGFSYRYENNKSKFKKYTLVCNHHRQHAPTHSSHCDPREWREGKTIKTGCKAAVNVNRITETDMWYLSTVRLAHNHSPQLEPGVKPRNRPTQDQKQVIKRLATSNLNNFRRGHILGILDAQDSAGGAPLEPRQISNIMNEGRREKRQEEESGWALLHQKYGDIIILNDNTYKRNMYGYALNIGIVIDGQGCSRNAWYCLMAFETIDYHSWVLQSSLKASGKQPDIFMSDRDAALIAASRVAQIFFGPGPWPSQGQAGPSQGQQGHDPTSGQSNLDTNLRSVVPWTKFLPCFWAAFRAVSPEEFDRLWQDLCDQYPSAAPYLQSLYDCRQHWAWAWTSQIFTAGVGTNGRVESENRVTTNFGGPKKTGSQLFSGLNERTEQQERKEKAQSRDSHRRHAHSIEAVFPGPVCLLREHITLYAFQRSYEQMKESMYYTVDSFMLPAGSRSWNDWAVAVRNEPGFSWADSETSNGPGMFNNFSNDCAYISTKWLLRQTLERGNIVEQLYNVKRGVGEATVEHVVAALRGGSYVCDCMMGVNLGIPCRHFYAILRRNQNMALSLGHFRRRWYKDQKLDLSHVGAAKASELEPPRLIGNTVQTVPLPNPLEDIHTNTAPPPTQTLPSREALYEAQAALRPIVNTIQTQEDMNDLQRVLQEYLLNRNTEGRIRDPPALDPKGRPRDARLTSAREGPPRGGGARRGPRATQQPAQQATQQATQAQQHVEPQATAPEPTQRRCRNCRGTGHNTRTCKA